MNPYFTADEFARRWERALALMAERGLSGLFVTSEANLYYLTGHHPIQPWHSTTRPTVLLVPSGSSQGGTPAPALLSHEVWKGAAVRDSWLQDVRGYTDLDGIPTEMLVALFRELDMADGRVGIEAGLEQRLGMPLADLLALQEALPGVEWIDAAELLWELRRIKSDAEIACVRRSCAVTMEAFGEVFPRLEPGMTQEEVTYALQAAISRGGAQFGFAIPAWAPESYTAMGSLPTQQRLEEGDLIWVDMGAVYHGYWCDFSRAVCLGCPSDEVLGKWEAVHRVTMRAVQAVGPRVPVKHVVEAAAAEAERQGLDLNFAAGRIGHGLGLMLTEPPSLTLEEEAVLEPGMVVTLEPGIVDVSGVYVVEQNVAVTEEGYDLLSQGRWEIWRT